MSDRKVKNEISLLAVSACLTALSIIFGKFLAINIGTSFRLSFENLPILLAGYYFGSVTGFAVAFVADITGCVMVGYSINPIITLGAAFIGLIAGLFGSVPVQNKLLKAVMTVVPAHMIGSVIVKTIGFVAYYSQPVLPTFSWRLLIYTVTSIAETGILYMLISNRSFDQQMRKLEKNPR
ncbi:MAG: folate family ECF transporter S component [Clostridia bacterium]|nr:folate family ECF transporter S component [Clostridia bacterium]